MGDPKGGPGAVSVGFTDEPLPRSHHACLIFQDDEQRQRVVAEYLATGIRDRELVRYFADVTPPERIRSWLEPLGVDVADAERSGGFSVSPAGAAYCPAGRFDPEGMIAGLHQRYAAAEKAGYTASRVCAEMSWALAGLPGSERVLEYEALLNTIQTSFPHVGMCQYDARRFDGATLFKVLQVHPFMVSAGQIVRNPNYMKPEEFLAVLRRG